MSWEYQELLKREEFRKKYWVVEETEVDAVKGELFYSTKNARLLAMKHDGLESTSLYIGDGRHFFFVERYNKEYNSNYLDCIIPCTAQDAYTFFCCATEKFWPNITGLIEVA